MRAARYHANRDVRVEDVAAPAPEPDEVVVDVAACGICGSDLAEYSHGPRAGEESLPYVMGHEFGGTVAETGADADVAVGTEVVVNPLVACEDCWCCDAGQYNLCRNLVVVGAQRPGAYAERVRVPATNVVPLPDGVSPETAAVAEPFTVAYHGLLQSPIRSGDDVAVVGMGPIGLATVQLARDVGAGTVYASGHREARRALAAECGADVVVDPRETDFVETVRENTRGGADVAFDVTGTESGYADAVGATRPDGHTTLVGVFEDAIEADIMEYVSAQRSATGSAAYQTGPRAGEEFGTVLRKFAAGDLDPEPLVTSRIALDDIESEGFEALADSDSGEVKVLVRP
ncbi:(R,R)-butanediol dehydrogenase/meso-butanediol dehydrogenase/diacetyl reductase [Halarchaeum rubridurum]|uniref:(R,R)-butanediol dehydrogenase/meso-butanediol dehydrogenase/diacetyl reductase n=1 Tax=Halarchaeum rubridurum TaxID=489911 RepID=A0A830FXG5_9EURY|nr:alcohol dehydrogenase catalytic domain-containing protein [Halarchaeum rubridurum]MBP1954791.1 (R,R)-butanediol dehydrogenase/meso-butanediol dehydrogenase/diacetyl reductase [Halarchaeum rubridurum]GGM59773.1 2,3-butanediol dehydrogenase [Halarchaeum rubridurum]